MCGAGYGAQHTVKTDKTKQSVALSEGSKGTENNIIET